MASNTGLGATVVFSGGITAYTGRIKSISGLDKSIEPLDDTALDAAGFYESVPDDLAKAAPITIQYFWDYKKAEPSLGTVGTITITAPLQSGQTTPLTLSGSGYITRIVQPELTTGQRLMGTIEIQFDGKTGPTHLAAT